MFGMWHKGCIKKRGRLWWHWKTLWGVSSLHELVDVLQQRHHHPAFTHISRSQTPRSTFHTSRGRRQTPTWRPSAAPTQSPPWWWACASRPARYCGSPQALSPRSCAAWPSERRPCTGRSISQFPYSVIKTKRKELSVNIDTIDTKKLGRPLVVMLDEMEVGNNTDDGQ